MGIAREQRAYRLDRFVEALDFFLERGQGIGFRGIRSALEEGAHVAHQCRHVTDQLGGSADPVAGTEGRIVLRRVPQRFLRAIGDGGKEVAQQLAVTVHDGNYASAPPGT